ncbi:MAG: oxidoreductase, partial [Reyranella sp.]|nr:oxidoreductase [Reyranella sp.]
GGRGEKGAPAKAADSGFRAESDGENGVVTGWQNKLQVALSKVLPETVMAEQHAKKAAPGSGVEKQ